MEARKLNQDAERIESLSPQALTFVALKNPTDRSWLETVDRYRESGVVNDILLRQLVLQLDWHAYYVERPFYNASKAVFDRLVAAVALVVALPVLLAAAIGIKLTSRGSIFYSQNRIGKNCQPFRIYKFRTMDTSAKRALLMTRNEMKGGLFKMRRDPRVTSVGRILRRWSIDEVPQLWNVLKGDMSLVGPRPLPPEDTATVAVECYLRFAVKPGLTGLWQATARDSLDGSIKLRLDAEYAQNRSWLFDLWLIWRTVFTIVRGVGAW